MFILLKFKEKGLEYLRMKNFIHKSTDGPDNVYATVWNNKSANKLFYQFKNVETKVHFLNERHLLGFQNILTNSLKQKNSHKFGWHLWIFAIK